MAITTISVGIDRSTAASEALRWAAEFATVSHAKIRAISTWQMPLVGVLPDSIGGLPTPEVMAGQCTNLVEGVVAALGPDVPTEQVVAEGKPGPTLLAESATSDLLVVGRTGQGKRRGIARVAEVVLGSTARHCIHHATQPIAAVPEGSIWKDSANVLVGLDGSPSSLQALEWALTNLPPNTTINVMRAFAPWVGDGMYPMDLVNETTIHDSIRRETQDWVDAALDQLTPTVTAAPRVDVMIGNARDALTNPGYDTDLVVVGERGSTGIAAMVLGSVSDHLVRYASCPVVVVPDGRTSSP